MFLCHRLVRNNETHLCGDLNPFIHNKRFPKRCLREEAALIDPTTYDPHSSCDWRYYELTGFFFLPLLKVSVTLKYRPVLDPLYVRQPPLSYYFTQSVNT